MTTQGYTHLTMSTLLNGYQYDAGLSASLAMPTGVDGGAFTNASNQHIYVLWAVTTIDNSEAASATYSFPAPLGVSTLTRYEVLYSQTATGNMTSNVAPINIPLTGAPSFFK